MAATKVPIEAINYATEFVKFMPIWRIQLSLLQKVSDDLWFAAPWRWTTGNLPNTTLINNQQDYVVTLPSDFEYGIDAYLANSTDRSSPKPLEIVSTLPIITASSQKGQPVQIAINGSGVSGQYRFSPVPSGYGTDYPLPIVQGQYKKTAPILTDTNIYTAGTLLFPDQYFRVFELGVLAEAYQYADDQRAGNMTFDGKNMQYSGMLGKYQAAIQDMRIREKLPLAPVKIVPDAKIEKG